MMALSEIQSQVRVFDEEAGWSADKPGHVILHMLEELGEIAREITRIEGYKREEADVEGLGRELCDLQYLLLKLANKFDVDLNGEWELMWPRLKRKAGGG